MRMGKALIKNLYKEVKLPLWRLTYQIHHVSELGD
jgi:hypothetical protein